MKLSDSKLWSRVSTMESVPIVEKYLRIDLINGKISDPSYLETRLKKQTSNVQFGIVKEI